MPNWWRSQRSQGQDITDFKNYDVNIHMDLYIPPDGPSEETEERAKNLQHIHKPLIISWVLCIFPGKAKVLLFGYTEAVTLEVMS